MAGKPKKDEKKYGYRRVVNIGLIGASRAGKTSLLATMHRQMQDALAGELRFEPIEDPTYQILSKKYADLAKEAKRPACTRLTPIYGRTQTIQEYLFGLEHVGANGKRKKIALIKFFDTPGAMTDTLDSNLKERLREADIVINAIDAGAMMEAESPWREKFNGYDQVRRLLDDQVLVDDHNKLVIFTLIKAETWTTDRGNRTKAVPEAKKLLSTAKEQLGITLNLFSTGVSDHRLAIICPVETLGCVEFSLLAKGENEDDAPEVHYKRMAGKEFDPKYVHLPLSYALRFILAEWTKNITLIDWIWDKLVIKSFTEVIKSIERMEDKTNSNIQNATFTPFLIGNQALLVKNA